MFNLFALLFYRSEKRWTKDVQDDLNPK